MKKLLLFLMIVFFISTAHAQVNNNPTQSTNKVVNQNATSVTYQLFSTQNIWNFIKLDTRNGEMWQVQWSTESDKRFVSNLNLIPLVAKEDEKNGRFTLYPTQNINTFLLIDQIDGRVWQVQWSFDPDKRLVIPVL
jgi:hypothetical protein